VEDDIDVLLVTGSRSLANLAESDGWTRRVIERAAIRISLTGGIITGDARGPDAWAKRIGAGLRAARVYGLDGWIKRWWTQSDGTVASAMIGRWTKGQSPQPDDHDARRQWCLARDRAEVDEAALQQRQGRKVLVLGLIDPQSRTHGTEYTCHYARNAGLVVVPETWASE